MLNFLRFMHSNRCTGLLLIFFNLFGLKSTGQSLIFKSRSYDFGQIAEGEIVNHYFNFSNTSTIPLKISFVRSSCGCTTPSWPKQSIAPSDTGSVYVEFNSTGRIGRINKIIVVVLENSTKRISLTITGYVKGKEEPSLAVKQENYITDTLEDKYKKPILLNPVEEMSQTTRIPTEEDTIRLGKIEKGQSIFYFFAFQNSGKKTIKISDIVTSSDAIRIYSEEQNIKPGKMVEIKIEVDASNKLPEWNYLLIKTIYATKKERKIWIQTEWVEAIAEQNMMRLGE